MVASGALARGVPRVHEDHLHAVGEGLVDDQGAQLMERPPAVAGSLVMPNRCPLADACQVFQGDAARGALGSLANEGVGDLVVLDASKAGLLARDMLERAACAARGASLQVSAKPGVLAADSFGLGAGVVGAFAVGGEVLQPQIHPQEALARDRGLLVQRGAEVEVDLTLAHQELGLAHASDLGEQRALRRSEGVGAKDAGLGAAEADLVLVGQEGGEALVVGEGRVLAEGGAAFGGGGEGRSHRRAGLDSLLGRQAKEPAKFAVVGLLDGEGGAEWGGPDLLSKPGTSVVESSQQGNDLGPLGG